MSSGDKTWVHYFEPVRKVSNKILATKHSKTPNNCQTFFEYKEGFVCNLLLWLGSRNKSASEEGKSITGKYYEDVVLKKLKKYYQKRRPATGFKHVCHLHDNAPAHTSTIVTAFLKKEKVKK